MDIGGLFFWKGSGLHDRREIGLTSRTDDSVLCLSFKWGNFLIAIACLTPLALNQFSLYSVWFSIGYSEVGVVGGGGAVKNCPCVIRHLHFWHVFMPFGPATLSKQVP